MSFFRHILLGAIICLTLSNQLNAQSAAADKVAAAVEKLRTAMIAGDSIQLSPLLSPQLSYGHSNGLIENRSEFLHKLSSGISDFLTMNLSEQTIIVSGNTAIVRHVLDGDINDNGKAGTIHLKVMLVWEKVRGAWRLLARQAVKVQ